jgi:hypothetical protein
MKFALMLSTLDFDSAIRGYLPTPLALRVLTAGETRDRESSRVPAGDPGHPDAPCISSAGNGFSSDVAYSERPAASRASSSVRKNCHDAAIPSR